MNIKTNSEATNVLGTFLYEWERLGQLPPWKDPKVLSERQPIANLDLERVSERLKHAYTLLEGQKHV